MTLQSEPGLCAPDDLARVRAAVAEALKSGDDDECLTVQQVAARLNLHPNSVYKQLRQGTFPVRARKIGRVWRISRRQVDYFLSEVEGPRP